MACQGARPLRRAAWAEVAAYNPTIACLPQLQLVADGCGLVQRQPVASSLRPGYLLRAAGLRLRTRAHVLRRSSGVGDMLFERLDHGRE